MYINDTFLLIQLISAKNVLLHGGTKKPALNMNTG